MHARTPKSIALIDAGGAGDELPGLILADLADALAAYAKLGGTPAPRISDDPRTADATVCAWYWDGNEAQLPALGGRLDYAIVCCEGRSMDIARETHARAQSAIGPGWAGTLIIMGAERLAGHMGRPRMGRTRRYASETIDDLVLALRCGKPLGAVAATPRKPVRLD